MVSTQPVHPHPGQNSEPAAFPSQKESASSTAISPGSRASSSTNKRKRQSASGVKSLLRSAGLKVLAVGKPFKRREQKEERKVLVSKSRYIAIARLGAHILPILITSFIIVFNAVGVLNGPDINSISRLSLQLASKVHVRTSVPIVLNGKNHD